MQRILPDWQTLSLEQQVAQLFVVRTTGHLFDHQIRYPQWEAPNATLKHWIQDLGVGGVILLGGSAAELALRTQQLQDWADLPLFLAADIEEGVGQRFAGAIWMPPPMALGAIAQTHLNLALNLAEQFGSTTAEEAHAIGLNWVLAPVVDVNNNPLNPVINVRAFGEDPAMVSQLTTAFIRGVQSHPVLATAKHFPGHGDTATDSHLDLPQIRHAWERLHAVELEPFRAAIATSVASIMTAHLLLPSLDTEYPATLSPKILTDLLRENLGFDGLIVTDALVMQAITQRYGPYEAPVLAFEAGADVLLMPVDPVGAIEAVCEALRVGRIPVERLHYSLERIWRAKMRINDVPESLGSCHAWEGEPPPTISLAPLAQPETLALRDQILQTAQQTSGAIPLAALEQAGRNLVLVDNLLETPFLNSASPAIALPPTYGYRSQWFDQQSIHALPTDPSLNPPTLVQLFIRGNPFRGSAGSSASAIALLQTLLDQNHLRGLVVYGSPYVWQQLLAILPQDLPAVFSYGQMPAAQAIALQTLFQGDQEGQGDRPLPGKSLPHAVPGFLSENRPEKRTEMTSETHKKVRFETPIQAFTD